MSQSAVAPKPADIAEAFDLGFVTKYGAIFAALTYATGTLTINIFLHKVGITDFALARPKLILTGIVVLISFLLLALLPALGAWKISFGRNLKLHERAPASVLVLLFSPLLALIVASGILCFGDTGLGQITIWSVWAFLADHGHMPKLWTRILATLLIAAEVYLPICVAAISAIAAVRFFERAQSETGLSGVVPARVYGPVAVSLVVVSIVAYISIFALTFYPAIPTAFGGGKPYFESFVIQSGQCQLRQLGIPFESATSNLTELLPVLHESDSMVAVWLNKNKNKKDGGWHSVVVQLDKSQIMASVADSRQEETPKLKPSGIPCGI